MTNWSTFENLDEKVSGQLGSQGLLGTSSYGKAALTNVAGAQKFASNQAQIGALTKQATDNLAAATSFRRGAEDSVFGGDYASKAGDYEAKYKANKAAIESLQATNKTAGDNPYLQGIADPALAQTDQTLESLATGEKNISSGGTVWSRTITPIIAGLALNAVGGLGGLLKTAGDITGIGAAIQPGLDAVNTAVGGVGQAVQDVAGNIAAPVETALKQAGNVPQAEIGPIGQLIENVAKRFENFPVEDVVTRIAFGEEPKNVIKEALATAKQVTAFNEYKRTHPDAQIQQTITNPFSGETIHANSNTTKVDNQGNVTVGPKAAYERAEELIKDHGVQVRTHKGGTIPPKSMIANVGGMGQSVITAEHAPEFKPSAFNTFVTGELPTKKGEKFVMKGNVLGIEKSSPTIYASGSAGSSIQIMPFDPNRKLDTGQRWVKTRNGQDAIETQKRVLVGQGTNALLKDKAYEAAVSKHKAILDTAKGTDGTYNVAKLKSVLATALDSKTMTLSEKTILEKNLVKEVGDDSVSQLKKMAESFGNKKDKK